MVVLVMLSGIALHMPSAVADLPRPVADAGPDQTVQEGDEVTLNASGSYDLNDEPLTYSWDFDAGDGSTTDVDATGIEVVTVYEDAGIYTVTLTVSDGDYDDTDSCRITVTPAPPDNTRPKAIITAPLPNVYNVSTPIAFDGTGVDLDDDPLTGKWNFGDGTTSSIPVTTHSYAREGTYYIRWTVTDGTANNTARTVIYVGEVPTPEINRRPSAVIIASRTNISEGETIRFSASNSSDPDGDLLTYEWDFDLSNGLQTQSTEENVTWQFNNSGTYTVTLQVRDGKVGGWDIARVEVSVNVLPNDPPIANAGNDAEVQLGVQLQFRGTATDPDGDNITLWRWDFGDGSSWESETNGTTTHAYLTVDVFTATFTVTDERGESDSDTRTITVKAPPDQPPTANAGPDHNILEGETVQFDGQGSDDFGIALYEWDFNNDGVWDYQSPEHGRATWTYNVDGVFTAILRVTENNRPGVTTPPKKATDSAIVTVRQNMPPDAKIRVDSPFVNCGEVVRFRSESTDPENGRLEHAWDLNGDGATDSTATNPSFVYRRGGDYLVTLTVTDEKGNTDSASIAMSVTQTFSVTLEIQSPEYQAEPGERHEFRMTVTNKGNGDDMLRITVSGTNSGWSTLDRASVKLNASEKQTVTLTVRVPSTALSTDTADLTVTAESTYGSASASGGVQVSVRQRFAMKAAIDVQELTMAPGDNKEGAVRVTVTNDGNGPDSFRVSFSGDIAGFLTASTPKVDLNPGQYRDIDLTAFILNTAEAGEYTGTVTVSSTKSTVKQSFEFTVTVKGEEPNAITKIFEDRLMLVLIVIVLAVLVGIAATLRRGRARANSAPKPSPKPAPKGAAKASPKGAQTVTPTEAAKG